VSGFVENKDNDNEDRAFSLLFVVNGQAAIVGYKFFIDPTSDPASGQVVPQETYPLPERFVTQQGESIYNDATMPAYLDRRGCKEGDDNVPLDDQTVIFPVKIYRTGGVGAIGQLGCGIHYPELVTLTGPQVITIPGEGVRPSGAFTGYSAYEIQAFDALDRAVYSAVVNNQTGATAATNTGLNVELIVDTSNFSVGYPCMSVGSGWCGCFQV
jgi:hypothetical protein